MFDPDGSINNWIMKVLGHSDLMSSHNYANVNIVIGVKIADPDLKAAMSAIREEMNHIKEENASQKEMFREIKEVITRPPRDEFDELADDDAPRIHLIALPKTGGGHFYVKPFDRKIFTRRFRPDQQEEKATLSKARHDQIEAAFGDNVIWAKMTDVMWRQLNVIRDVGRELSGQ